MEPKTSPMFRAIVLAGVALTACGSETVSGSDASASDGAASSDSSTKDATSDTATAEDAGADTGLEPADARDDFPLIK
jgi:hypothetical protein